MAAQQQVDSALGRLFARPHFVVEAVPGEVDAELYPAEREYIRGAVAKRRAEFGTARVSVRRALAAMGRPPVALVPRADRSPSWPPGIVGSITHTNAYCAVVVDGSPPLLSIGLDAEELRVLEPGVSDSILTGRERSWLSTQPRTSQDDLTLLFFSAKEAYYKCQYPLTRTFLDFRDVEVEVASAEGRFEARVLRTPWPAPLARLEGRFVYDRGRVLCGIECFG